MGSPTKLPADRGPEAPAATCRASEAAPGLEGAGAELRVAAVAIAVLAVVYAEGVWKIIVAVIVAAVYPMLITYIEIAMVSKGLIESVGDFVNPIKEEVVDTPIVTENTEDDYIFVNGRMVKNPNKK